MVRVVWTREALANLELIRAYIQQFDPAAAQRLATRLIEAGDSLRDFPERGRPLADGRREFVIVPPYTIRYRLHADQVFILSLQHGAQQMT